MPKPTPQQIRAKLEQEQYQDFLVTDAQSFPQCAYNGTKAPVMLLSSAPGKHPNMAPSPTGQNKLLKASSFAAAIEETDNKTVPVTNKSTNQTKNHKRAECSNFAKHGVGMLLADKNIRDHYNVVMIAGMYMENPILDRTKTKQQGKAVYILDDEGKPKKRCYFGHNLVALIPKEHNLELENDKVVGTKGVKFDSILKGGLPPDTLIVDPWARGMGYPADRSLAVPLKDAPPFNLTTIQVTYQSKLDDTLEQFLQEGKGQKWVARAGEMPEGGAEQTKPKLPPLQFRGFEPVPEALSPLFAPIRQFDAQLEEIKIKANYFHANDYPKAAAEALKTYNELADARNAFVKQPLTNQSKDQFISRCNTTIDRAKEGELGYARGFSQIFFYLVKAIAYVATVGYYSKQTDTINKVQAIKASLQEIKPQVGSGPEYDDQTTTNTVQ